MIKKPIEEGDCGIILRKDGGFEVFSTGKIDPNNMTDRQIKKGTLLTALSVCLNVPQLRETMMKLATDPAIVGADPFRASVN